MAHTARTSKRISAWDFDNQDVSREAAAVAAEAQLPVY